MAWVENIKPTSGCTAITSLRGAQRGGSIDFKRADTRKIHNVFRRTQAREQYPSMAQVWNEP